MGFFLGASLLDVHSGLSKASSLVARHCFELGEHPLTLKEISEMPVLKSTSEIFDFS